MTRSVDLAPYRALTSHLIDCPPSGEISALKVAFIRRPLARYLSAFLFTRDVQKNIASDVTFEQYLKSQSHTIISNFQARHLSPQGDLGFSASQGWQLRPDLINLYRDDLMVGTVERFDESLVVFEYRAALLGLTFDFSYPAALNQASKSARQAQSPIDCGEPWLRGMLELDQNVWDIANQRLDEAIAMIPDFSHKLCDFSQRCSALSRNPDASASVIVQPPSRWTYISSP
ncbi:MAG: hypothetical protein AAFX65_02360 [Cyanobacteria bacterium J06638_7]